MTNTTTYESLSTVTMAATLARNAHGTITNIVDSTGLNHAYAVNARQLVTNETVTLDNRIFNVGKARDARGRAATTSVRLTNAVYASKSRAYDSENQLAAPAFTNAHGRACTASYAYSGSHQTNMTLMLPSDASFTRSLTRDAHRPALVTCHDYAFNGSPLLWYACGHDILGRVTNAWDSLSVVRAVPL